MSNLFCCNEYMDVRTHPSIAVFYTILTRKVIQFQIFSSILLAMILYMLYNIKVLYISTIIDIKLYNLLLVQNYKCFNDTIAAYIALHCIHLITL